MATPAGTLEILARELAIALQPLEQRLAADRADGFLTDLGLRLPPTVLTAVGAPIGVLAQQAAALTPVLQALATAVTAEDSAAIVRAGVDLLGRVKLVLDAISALGPAVSAALGAATGLPADQKAELQALATELPKRLLDFVLMSYVEGKSADAIPTLRLLGVVDDTPQTTDPNDPVQLPVRHRVLHLDRLVSFFTDPATWLADAYGFGTPGFDGLTLFSRIGELLDVLDLPSLLLAPAGGPNALEAFLLRFAVDPATTPPSLSTRLRIPASFDVSQKLASGAVWSVGFTAASRFEAGLDAHITPPFALTVNGLDGSVQLDVSLDLTAERGGAPMLLLGVAGGSRVELTKFSASLGVRATAAADGSVQTEPFARLALEGGRVVVDLSDGDGFLTSVTGGGTIEAPLTLSASWSPSGGLQLDGGSLAVSLPLHLSLGPVDVTALTLAAGPPAAGALPIEVSGSFIATLGPVTAAVERAGLQIVPRFTNGNLGPLDLSVGFKAPTGVGLSVNAGLVAGGGFLSFDPARGEYSGALDLEFADFLALKGIGLISTRNPDGSPGFSLLVVLTAEFGSTGLQLGEGFTLLAVGGILGLNRSMNLQALVEGVRTGAVESVMFPKDVVANAPRILSDLRSFFPAEAGKFVVGPMAKLSWGTPTVISVSLGVVIEIPGNLAVIGVLRAQLPDADRALLRLQVDFVGALEFDKQRLWLFAQLFDSRILTMPLSGSMGVLVAWGDNPDLIVTVGGFHPAFRPPPLPFPVPERLTVDLLNRSGQLIRASGYFAITSNTVQFGGEVQLKLGFDGFGIEGHLGFDALFQFSPFRFVVAVHGRVSLKAFGVGLFHIDLRFALEGPAPFRAHGRGSIGFLFFEISADFDITWGESRDTTLPPIDVLPLLAAEVTKVEGWLTRLPAGRGALVNLRQLPPGDGLVLHPLGTLVVRQRAIPLNVRLDRVGARRARDGRRFGVTPLDGGALQQAGVTSDKFAMGQFQNLSEAQQLSLPAYADQDAGLELAGRNGELTSVRAVRRSARYEAIVIDSTRAHALAGTVASAAPARPRPAPRRLTTVSPAVFGQLLTGSSTARSVLSRQDAGAKQPFAAADTVRLGGGRFVIAYVRNNQQAFPPTPSLGAGVAAASFRSQAAAEDALADWIKAAPGLAGTLHVIPAADASAPLAVANTWSAGGALPFAAAWATADAPVVRLGDGRLLAVSGGQSALFDPVRTLWTPGPAPLHVHDGHTLTLLDDGRVLVAGTDAEIFDPRTGGWTATGPSATGPEYRNHSATLLGDGTVLVAGGTGGGDAVTAAVQRFDPHTGAWAAADPLTDGRAAHQAVLLDDGRLLVAGGVVTTGAGARRATAYCELFDPGTGHWTPTGSLAGARAGHSATLLPDHSVLVAGGDTIGLRPDGTFSARSLATAERFTPATGTWHAAAAMPGPRTRHRALLVRTGEVLLTGGTSGPGFTAGYRSVVVYDPGHDRWSPTGGLVNGRRDHAVAQLTDGRIVATGGLGGDDPTAGTEVFTP
ncbi:DUF6603 domain-containing protein [Dactylosporangium sp. McL0621]|uniref:DUF6603 domain-containing protein n=1 Tax=Dactylosporangium sp. McL0621 TaxID=3415678 RepID=UPI003CEF90E7